ncbi:MAG: C25 family cysteine peptidase, partial [Candidatus Krumholzibacteriia bacterium]
MVRHVFARLFACLALIALIVPAVADARPPQVTTLAAGADGVRARVELPADAEPWTGLVALPPGRTLLPGDLPAGVTVGDIAIMHGVRIAPVTVNGRPDRATSVNLDLGFGTAAPRPHERTVLAASFARLLESATLGGAAVRAAYDEVPGTYLMICSGTAGVVEAVAPLAEWRREQGYAVEVVSTATIGGSTTAIKGFIQEVYDTAAAPLAYVVLVGDAGGTVNVPTWYETISGYNGEGDHQYVTLEGNDVLADAHVGRLTCRSVSELEGIVAKILAYERTPDTFSDPDWFDRAVLVGDPSHSGATTIYVNQWVKEQLLDLGYTQIDTIWGGNFPSLITQKLNLGASVYSYRGYLGCSGFSTGYIDNLQNQGELPFAVMPTCGSGSFAATHTYTEAMLRNPHGGAIGAVGTATIGTHTRYNNCYFHGVWEGALNDPDRHLGYAHSRGKLELFRQYQQNEPNIVAIWSTWNNLMGDPATEMRQALPVSPQVTYPTVVPAAAGALPVTVTVGGQPLAGARVTAWRDADLQATAWTGPSGEVLLALPAGLPAGAVHLTVSGDDLMPHRGTLQIGSTDAYCAAVGWTWNDGQDGMPDPGETGELTLQVQNLGQVTAPSVAVGLESLDGVVEVSGADIILGDLAPGVSANAGSWTVTLPDDLPDGLPVSLTVRAHGSGAVWSSQAVLPIVAPAFELANVQWNGLPGQTGNLDLVLQNTGSAAALGAEVSLATTGAFLMPAGPVTLALGDVPTTGAAPASFALAVAADAWGGNLTTCVLTVTTATGTRQRIELPLTTGSINQNSPVGPGSMGYLAWDDQDPVADAPAYWWRELDPSFGGGGTDVGLTDFGYEQDDTRTVELPFVFTYRGRDFDRISICSNGWVALGHTYLVHWRNWSLPAAGSPDVMLAVFWDDLYQSGTNRVYHEYRPTDGVYVVQWSRMRNQAGGMQNCELILYDPAVHPTATGDGLVVYQYQQVTNNDSNRGYATVGIQDGQDGLTYTYYNRYANAARTLQSGRAIAFVPTPPAAVAVAAVAPASVSAVLLPGEVRTRTLEISNLGGEGSQLWWQLAVRDVPTATRAADEPTRDRTVTLLSPNGGEVWAIGQVRLVQWEHGGDVSAVNLQLDRGDGWQDLVTGLDADLGSWAWTVAGPSADGCRVRVVDHGDVFVNDASDGTFTIAADFSWLGIDLTAGQLPSGSTDEVTVTLDATDLTPGEYMAELVITSTGGAPVVIPVNLLVDTS